VTKKPRPAWMAQMLLGALVWGLGTGAYGEPFPYPLGDIPLSPEAYRTKLKAIPSDRMAEIQAALPTAYNAADRGFVTPAKNQGSCGSCWAFASVGSVESKLLMRGASPWPNVSEQQQVSCNTEMWGCNGGSMESLLFWAPPPEPGNGPLPESIFPYTASDATACYNPSPSQMPYRVRNWHTLPQTIEAFKASLYEDGPSYWRYDVHADFSAFWDKAKPGAVYKWDGKAAFEGGHAVLLIGWDDTKQALLLKNSWGEKSGPDANGTFWISYSDLSNLGFAMANFDLDAGATAIPTLSEWMLIFVTLSLFAAGTYRLHQRPRTLPSRSL
jgi:C1A family cysteine protease